MLRERSWTTFRNKIRFLLPKLSLGIYRKWGHSVKSGDWDKVEDVLALIEAYQLKNDKAQLINPKKLRAEVRYNEMNIFGRTKVGYFILGGLLLLVAMAQLLRNRSWFHYASLVFTIGIILLFLYHMFGMGLRWYISGYAPWSNSYETMVYIAWATVLAGLLFGRRNNLTLALGYPLRRSNFIRVGAQLDGSAN